MSLGGGSRQALREWTSSTGFQIVVVPAALALVGLVLDSWLGEPGWAVAGTIVVVLVFATWFWFNYLAQRRRLVRFSDGAEAMVGRWEVLVTCISDQALDEGPPAAPTDAELDPALWDADTWAKSLPGRIAGRLRPGRAVLLATPEAQTSALNTQAWLTRLGVKSEVRDIERDSVADPQALRERFAGVLGDCRRSSVVVDITSGNKPMSVALFSAAEEAGASVTYLERTGTGEEEQVAVRLILEAAGRDTSASLPQDGVAA